jgi:hypothetical protein
MVYPTVPTVTTNPSRSYVRRRKLLDTCVARYPGLFNFGDRPLYTPDGGPNGVDGYGYSWSLRSRFGITVIAAGDEPQQENLPLAIITAFDHRVLALELVSDLLTRVMTELGNEIF